MTCRPTSSDATRLVAPLRKAGVYASFPNITPIVEFEGERWVVRLQEIASVPLGELGEPLGSLRDARDQIKRGIDVLIDGF